MRSMATDMTLLSRRSVLQAMGGLAALPAFSSSPLAEVLLAPEHRAGQLFASAFKAADGTYGIGVLDDYGQVLARIALPGRGHGVALSPEGTCLVAFARRPGAFLVVAHPFSDRSLQVVTATPGRHFYGHGCFSADRRLLYAAENAFDTGDGVIGVYDMSGEAPTRLGEFSTRGIGPHEILLDRDGKTLVVANGGIRTHPDRGREKLNLDNMRPSLVYLATETGDLVAEYRLDSDLQQLSLRHMALDGAGRAWVGGQFEGPSGETPPLIAVFARDAAPRTIDLPGKIAGLQNYIGAVAATADGSVIAASAPRGGKCLFLDTATGTLLGEQRIVDGCGIAPIDGQSFLISDGNGGISYLEEASGSAEILARAPGMAWDNHLTRFG